MQEITVKIKCDTPDGEHWLNYDNVSLALHAYCPNTKFEVAAVEQPLQADVCNCEQNHGVTITVNNPNEYVGWLIRIGEKNESEFVLSNL